MKKADFMKETRQQVDTINRHAGRRILAITGKTEQWDRSNGSVIRVDTNHVSTLSINWRSSFLAIGCDGKQSGINSYLAAHYPEHINNGQNIRYRIDYACLQDVLEYYANIPV
ncbi:hypothetical protein FP507_05090 [Chlorobium phaeovibrioides]|uniref:Uncharacterized protein n=1 Tax=Chlorobium phaeovibrioides TaxID=1094 RepID=A0A5M8IE38_CHLPH|nr:hypothetical protein [Chlorobium phaeovibrioides]KAA6232524.1 hypothetical protein FP507_05090 [Chlorobium phaeovibrioides]